MNCSFIKYFSCILFFTCIISCKPDQQIKKEICKQIDSTFCDKLRSTEVAEQQMLNEVRNLGDLISASIVVLEEEPFARTCKCVNRHVASRLSQKYSLAELRKIRNDKIHQIQVINGLLQNEKFNDEVKTCIKLVIQEYEGFIDRLKND